MTRQAGHSGPTFGSIDPMMMLSVHQENKEADVTLSVRKVTAILTLVLIMAGVFGHAWNTYNMASSAQQAVKELSDRAASKEDIQRLEKRLDKIDDKLDRMKR